MNENPYESPRSLAEGDERFRPRRIPSDRRTVRGAAWAGTKVGAATGAALGAATDVALVLIVLDRPPVRNNFASDLVRQLAFAGALVFAVVISMLIGAILGAFGFGSAAGINRLVRRRRGTADPPEVQGETT